jgi:hypothetical protein
MFAPNIGMCIMVDHFMVNGCFQMMLENASS